MRDLQNNIAIRQSIAPADHDESVTGESVDRLGHESATFAISVGEWQDGEHEFSAEHSDDGSDWQAVAAGDLLSDFPTVAANDESPPEPVGAETAYLVGYIGNKRYVRAVVDVEGATDGAAYGVDVILGHAHTRPTE